jgi:hypothetical protein
MRGGKDERVAQSLEREVICDGVHLVDKLAGFRRLFEDQFSGGQCEFLNQFAVRPGEFDLIRNRWTQAHPASLSDPRSAARSSGITSPVVAKGRRIKNALFGDTRNEFANRREDLEIARLREELSKEKDLRAKTAEELKKHQRTELYIRPQNRGKRK